MATRLLHEMRYDAPADAVAAMLTDPAFREQVCRNQRATSHDVRVDAETTPITVRVEMTQPTDRVPAFAKKFIGESTLIVQTETWTGPHQAEVLVTIPGKPGEMRGTLRLLEADGVTTETLDLSVTVKIPLVAGKLESMLVALLTSALHHEHRTGQEWLSR